MRVFGTGSIRRVQTIVDHTRAWSVLHIDGCYLRQSPAVIKMAPWQPRLGVQVSHNGRMGKAHDFKFALTRVTEPTGGPGAELATLEDAARFVGLMRPWRQAWPHWDYAAELVLKATETGRRRDVEAATAQMERALRRDGWL
jgi:hypothetical protein